MTIRGLFPPISRARIIFWLANPAGKYDDDHRATVFTDQAGAYRFASNFPGHYDGMPPHIHLFITAAGYRSLLPRAQSK